MTGTMSSIARVLIPAFMSFVVGILITPIVTHYLYKYKAWKKTAGKQALDGSSASEFNRLHAHHEVKAPRMGGVVIWVSVIITCACISVLAQCFPQSSLLKLTFLSRNQTWMPLATLLVGAIAGLVDDLLVIRPGGEGLKLRVRLLIVILLSGFIGWWFYAKLGITAVNIPFNAPLEIGSLIIPFHSGISRTVCIRRHRRHRRSFGRSLCVHFCVVYDNWISRKIK